MKESRHAALQHSLAEARLTQRRHSFGDLSVALILAYGVVAIALHKVFGQPESYFILRISYPTMAVLGALYFWPLRRFRPTWAPFAALFLQMACASWHAFMLHRMIVFGKHAETVVPALLYALGCFFLTFAIPFGGRARLVVASAYTLIGLAAVWIEIGTYFRYAVVLAIYSLCAGALAFLNERSERRHQIDVLRSRLKVAPLQLVRRSALEGVSLNDLLKPRMTTCICLASDWRGYQALATGLSPDDLAKALGDYYDLCQRLLSRAFPAGNYYSDWIADELLITFLPEPGQDDRAMAGRAIEFARWLLLAKEDFLTRHQLPRAIDIGLAYGETLVGQTGLANGRKVMSLGRVPLDSRRLQSRAKAMRERGGEVDRIAISEEMAALLGDEGLVKAFAQGLTRAKDESGVLYVIAADGAAA